MNGAGNDFIIIDNRSLQLGKEHGRELAKLACRRKISVGADGLMLIENDVEADFKWRFFNADGSEAEMCGNGARCVARFALLKGIVQKPHMVFRTCAGLIEAEVIGERAKVRMTQPHGLVMDIPIELENCVLDVSFIDTGVPHAVFFAQSEQQFEDIDVLSLGRSIRFHRRFEPAGANADFIHVLGPQNIALRTYERGVEGETLACGTGAMAGALTAAAKDLVVSPVDVRTRSGESLVIYFKISLQKDEKAFSDVYLEGDAKVVYDGELWDDTLRRPPAA